MKFNMGCGQNKMSGFVNVDKYAEASPDLLIDLEKTPWPIEKGCAEYILFNHCLEHMGANPDVFLSIIQETYRISKHDAEIQINVPHPRHDNFINDPTHVRIITPALLALFSKKEVAKWKAAGAANTPFAIYLDVDFEIKKIQQIPDGMFVDVFSQNNMSDDEIRRFIAERNNVISEYKITLRAVK
jgi:hypothetical protein